ncbi:hypothetical protein MNBD_GAMMA09-686 [hydrothermal vent metagenome]|uniref:Uncharacterized protein n=1 Tax=hydrothermal vent metagenome TaxID=652676 RepID=A0A3B0Y3X3_9ZZZZ
MKKIVIYLLLLIVIAGLWYGCIVLFNENMDIQNQMQLSDNTFNAINSLFSVLALVSIVYLLVLLTLDIKHSQVNTINTMLSNKLHLEITALSSLINECDTTLHRYDRWEKAGIKGDYTNAKADVREKMNAYRLKLEHVYEQTSEL